VVIVEHWARFDKIMEYSRMPLVDSQWAANTCVAVGLAFRMRSIAAMSMSDRILRNPPLR
jgi:hypothetical protein